MKDIYSTFEPQKAFQRRIEFLYKIHSDAYKALKYPENKEGKKKKENDVDLDEDDLMAGYMEF